MPEVQGARTHVLTFPWRFISIPLILPALVSLTSAALPTQHSLHRFLL